MPTIKYPKNPNIDTAFVEQDDGTKNRALMIAPQDISTLELPNNPNSTKGYITVDGQKQRVILTADITGGGGGGSSLPDQTGHSGEFLTTDGTDASWSDKPLVNTATGSSGFTVGGTPETILGGMNVGLYSIVSGRYALACGIGAEARGDGSVAINWFAKTTAKNAIAIGEKSIASAQYAIQLGGHTSYTRENSDANTFKVANANGNYEIMSADGTIPTARLTKVNSTITLTAAGWSGGSQTVSVSGVTSTSVVFVAPDPSDTADYVSAGILCTSQTTDSLTFTATTTPTSDIDVNIVCL